MRRPFEVSLDAMMNIAICLVGSLILVIIATGAGTAETNVVIPTPIERHSTKRTIYIECRNEELFLIPADELGSMASRAVGAARAAAGGDNDRFLEKISALRVTNETFEVGLRNFIAANERLLPVAAIPGAHGYPLSDYSREPADGWYSTLLARMNHAGESLYFLVRDDSFHVFKNARLLAWQTGADVSFELLSTDDVASLPVSRR